MNKGLFTLLFLLLLGTSTQVHAGNPDRQGEAGAVELLLTPWARGAGLHGMTTASAAGVEAMNINIAGMSRINRSELALGNTRLYEGADLGINSIGFVTKAGKGGAFGISLVAMDFGDNIVTTTDQPAGTGATYSPSFFNLALGYSYTYENRISVGVLVRMISESAPGISSNGIAIDAGVQYVTGPKDNFKLGITLKNTGSPMAFGGDALSQSVPDPDGDGYSLTFDVRSEDYELPSVLNIGLAYDYYFQDDLYLRGVGNFTSNAFGSDQIGAGLELIYREMFQLRGGYKLDIDADESRTNIYDGLSMGASVLLPVSKGGSKIALDYAYRTTTVFKGTHNLTLRLAI